MAGIVAIVGRPNVGKSTLFNRFTEARDAIVDDISGVTRDRIYGLCLWNGVDFTVVDTGGYVESANDVFELEIAKQVRIAVSEADVVLFMVDVETGITDLDQNVADMLRKSRKPVIPVVNKVDNHLRQQDTYIFYQLGLGELFCISSISGQGTGELLDAVVKAIPPGEKSNDNDLPRISIIGRPNVGKSSLVNALTGEERNIVTNIAGTTRDAIDTKFNKFGYNFILTDTAGLRKKEKVTDNLEFYSVMRAVKAIDNSDVCLLMIDAVAGIESQDINIMNLVLRKRKGLVLLVNKWDLMQKDTNTAKSYQENIFRKTAPFTDFPVLFISALQLQRVHKVLETAMQVFENRTRKITTSKLNEVVTEAVNAFHPPTSRGLQIKIKYAVQLNNPTPAFAFFANHPQYIKEPYRRYLENKIRENFMFSGVPIQIYFREK
ncbi:MAG: ribosome biogenesis GTPase Der [Bacteroidales bacterium]|nr:ribosome biogenesis GTPase Der [Bacteroidales bacterium]HOY37941.1 ribosome biogenesis GTPase Der [Bacteroidales bacterium]HQP03526.1 ribosome biogenesis GTPase Der [Bacteroidales bacterium]